jgi:hypothetical protein
MPNPQVLFQDFVQNVRAKVRRHLRPEDPDLPPEYVNHPLFLDNAGETRARIFKTLPNSREGALRTPGKLWDYIATMLLQLATEADPAPYSKALDNFFDPNIKTFEFSITHNIEKWTLEVRREGNEVLVGQVQNLCYTTANGLHSAGCFNLGNTIQKQMYSS